MASKSSSLLKAGRCWDCLFRFRPSMSAKSTQPSRTQDSTTRSNKVITSTAHSTQSGRQALRKVLGWTMSWKARTNSSRLSKTGLHLLSPCFHRLGSCQWWGILITLGSSNLTHTSSKVASKIKWSLPVDSKQSSQSQPAVLQCKELVRIVNN